MLVIIETFNNYRILTIISATLDMIRYDYDRKLVDLFEAIKYEKKWISLSMSDKLDFLQGMNKSLKTMRKMNEDEKIESITPDFILAHINERGGNRLRRIRNFYADVQNRRYDFLLSDRESNKDEIKEFKDRLRGVNL